MDWFGEKWVPYNASSDKPSNAPCRGTENAGKCEQAYSKQEAFFLSKGIGKGSIERL